MAKNEYRNGENGAKRKSTHYDVLDAREDGKYPVRDTLNRPLKVDGKGNLIIDVLKWIQEVNSKNGN